MNALRIDRESSVGARLATFDSANRALACARQLAEQVAVLAIVSALWGLVLYMALAPTS